eukprot:gene9375-biopygen22714
MGLKGSRDSRWEARLLPELIRIIGPHCARAGCGSHRGANSREACQISLPRRNSWKNGTPRRHPPARGLPIDAPKPTQPLSSSVQLFCTPNRGIFPNDALFFANCGAPALCGPAAPSHRPRSAEPA